MSVDAGRTLDSPHDVRPQQTTDSGVTTLAEAEFPGEFPSVSRARCLIAETLGDDHPHVDTAVLLVSECVTNSLLYSSSGNGGTVKVVTQAIPGGIRVEIIDSGGPTVPWPRTDGSALSETGRGLTLFTELATRWDFTSNRAGTTTWFELTGDS